MERKIICALDTPHLDEALGVVKRLAPYVGAFKIGHGLCLPNGLSVIEKLKEAGASRVFLDLKFHDIPNSVALAVNQAAEYGAWMVTLHIAGGPAMLTAAIEEARSFPEDKQPLLVGVSVLTSLDQHTLTDHLAVNRPIEEHMVALSELAVNLGIDGVVCSPHEIKALRQKLGHAPVIVTPGIRLSEGDTHDQKRVGDPKQALEDGADYLVIGRALTQSKNLEQALEAFHVLQ